MSPINNLLQQVPLDALDPLDDNLHAQAHVELLHVPDEGDFRGEARFVGDLGAHADGGGVHGGLEACAVAGWGRGRG